MNEPLPQILQAAALMVNGIPVCKVLSQADSTATKLPKWQDDTVTMKNQVIMALQVTMPSVYSAVKSNNRLFKLKTNRLKGRFVFDRIGFSDDLLR